MPDITNYEPLKTGDLSGFSRVQRPNFNGSGRWQAAPNALHEARVASAAELMADIMNGRAPAWALKEAIAPTHEATARALESNYPGLIRLEEAYSPSDFPLLMGDVLDRMLLARFRDQPGAWRQYIKVGRPLNDFRLVRRLKLDGAEGLYDQVDDLEGVEYTTTLAETGYSYSPELYAKGVKLTYRMIRDDDLGAFESIPDRLGRGGARTIANFATDILFDASGPDATFVSAGNGNLITGNPDLAIDALATAFQQLLSFTDVDGQPILVEGVKLVVPPGLWVTANNLMNQLTVDVTAAGGVSGQAIRVNNWIIRGVSLVMDPQIPIVCSTANGATSWLLVSDPNSGRPAAEVAFLAGFAEPQLFQKRAIPQLSAAE